MKNPKRPFPTTPEAIAEIARIKKDHYALIERIKILLKNKTAIDEPTERDLEKAKKTMEESHFELSFTIAGQPLPGAPTNRD